MKKIINILTFIFIIVLYHLTKNSNTFLLTFSFSLFLIYYSIFSSNKIKKLLNDYYDKKYLYTMNKVFKCSILLIIILTMLLGVISYIISTLINIEKLYLVNITMTIFLSISLIIKLINNYLNIFGYKKNILLNIRKEEGHGFIKKFRECSDEFFVECIKEYMTSFSMIKEEGESTIIMPLVSKVVGKYPKDYKGGTDDR